MSEIRYDAIKSCNIIRVERESESGSFDCRRDAIRCKRASCGLGIANVRRAKCIA